MPIKKTYWVSLLKSVGELAIGLRLAFGFGLVMILLVAIMAVSLLTMDTMQQRVDTMLGQQYAKVTAATEIKYNVSQIHQLLRSAIIAAEYQGENAVAGQIAPLRKRNADVLGSLRQGLADAADLNRLDLIEKAGVIDAANQKELFSLLNQGSLLEARSILNATIRLSEKEYVHALSEMVEAQSANMARESDAIRASYAAARRNILALGLAALLAGGLAAVFIVRGLLRQLGGEPLQASSVAGRIAGGNLTSVVPVRHGDEMSLMAALRTMQARLAALVGQARHGAEQIAAISREIALGNQDLSERTEHQASSLEETASSMEQLTATVGQNVANAKEANRIAQAASDIALEGGEVVRQVVDTMRGISDASKKVIDIIGVIDSIAFQTNILALNAAVEAARAGEQGRGFAVVASEVRNLAHRAAVAAKEIKTLIGDSAQRVDQGNTLVGRAGSIMDQVVDSVNRVTTVMAEIMQASEEQNTGIGQINQAVIGMDSLTQQNAALVEQVAAAAEAMQAQAGALVQVMGAFTLSGAQGNPEHSGQPQLSHRTAPVIQTE